MKTERKQRDRLKVWKKMMERKNVREIKPGRERIKRNERNEREAESSGCSATVVLSRRYLCFLLCDASAGDHCLRAPIGPYVMVAGFTVLEIS